MVRTFQWSIAQTFGKNQGWHFLFIPCSDRLTMVKNLSYPHYWLFYIACSCPSVKGQYPTMSHENISPYFFVLLIIHPKHHEKSPENPIPLTLNTHQNPWFSRDVHIFQTMGVYDWDLVWKWGARDHKSTVIVDLTLVIMMMIIQLYTYQTIPCDLVCVFC